MRFLFSIILLILVFESQVFSQTAFERDLKLFLQKPEYKNASTGISFVEIPKGVKIFSLNDEKLLIPASVMKLITTATAFELLGADFHFKTILGYSGEIDNFGNLDGNLIVKSGGDPTLGSAYFDVGDQTGFIKKWVDEIRKSGIKKIEGNLLLDNSIYELEEVPATWVWGDIGNYYGAGPNAFTCFDNLFTITFKSGNPGELAEIVKISPEIEGLIIENKVIASEEDIDNAYVYGSPIDKKRIIRGTIPANREKFSIKASIPDPAALLSGLIISELKKAGIELSGKAELANVNEDILDTILVYHSPKLAKILNVINHESVNLFAEHLLLQVAVFKTGKGTTSAGIKTVEDYWKSKGFEVTEVIMEDGSGLSHFNLVSPRFLTSLLLNMNNDEPNNAFYESLPSPGSGTLVSFSNELFPGNNLKAKSGSMTRVRCYSGYMKTDSGKTVAFSFMVNHFSGAHSKLRQEIEKLLYQAKKSF